MLATEAQRTQSFNRKSGKGSKVDSILNQKGETIGATFLSQCYSFEQFEALFKEILSLHEGWHKQIEEKPLTSDEFNKKFMELQSAEKQRVATHFENNDDAQMEFSVRFLALQILWHAPDFKTIFSFNVYGFDSYPRNLLYVIATCPLNSIGSFQRKSFKSLYRQSKS